MDQQKPKTQIKMTTKRKYEETSCMVCQNGQNSSRAIWQMKVFQKTETLPVLLINTFRAVSTHWYSRAQTRKIGDLVTADHKVFNEGGESRNIHRYGVVVQDSATQ